MGDGSHYVDIILFAMVAVFLGLRLHSVLGRRTGNERPPPATRPAPSAQPVPAAEFAPHREMLGASDDGSPAAGLARIRAADRSFDENAFRAGANAAFGIIVAAFAKGDEAALRPLLSDEVMERFAGVIRARRDSGETCETRLTDILAGDIVEARLDGREARITLRFKSEQIIVVRDAKGAVVEGDPDRRTQVVDLWTFGRDIRSRDPNWVLVATRSQDE